MEKYNDVFLLSYTGIKWSPPIPPSPDGVAQSMLLFIFCVFWCGHILGWRGHYVKYATTRYDEKPQLIQIRHRYDIPRRVFRGKESEIHNQMFFPKSDKGLFHICSGLPVLIASFTGGFTRRPVSHRVLSPFNREVCFLIHRHISLFSQNFREIFYSKDTVDFLVFSLTSWLLFFKIHRLFPDSPLTNINIWLFRIFANLCTFLFPFFNFSMHFHRFAIISFH
jgi:hypothetical protein